MVDIEKLDPEIREKIYRPPAEETKVVKVVFDEPPTPADAEIELDVNGAD